VKRAKPTPDEIPLRSDPARRMRDLLGPWTRKHVDLMEKVKAHHVSTDRDAHLKTEMEMTLENVVKRRDPSRPYGADNRLEGTAIAIISESGAGKTTAMLNYLRNNPFFPNYANPDGGCQLITVGVKAPCTLRQLGMATLRSAGYASTREYSESEAWPQAHFLVAEQAILFLHYEEGQRIIKQQNVVERKKIVETLAGLMTDQVWPLYLILSGLPAMKDLFQDSFLGHTKPASEIDAHVTLKRRTRFVEFLPIDAKTDRKMLDEGLRQYEKIAGVSLKIVKEAEARARLSHAAARQLGLFFELTVLAIDACVRAGRKAVTLDDFADAYAGRVIETVELNPFVVDHWESIDTRIIQRGPEPDEDETVPGKPERRRSEK
jgi:hypothetical protein